MVQLIGGAAVVMTQPAQLTHDNTAPPPRPTATGYRPPLPPNGDASLSRKAGVRAPPPRNGCVEEAEQSPQWPRQEGGAPRQPAEEHYPGHPQQEGRAPRQPTGDHYLGHPRPPFWSRGEELRRPSSYHERRGPKVEERRSTPGDSIQRTRREWEGRADGHREPHGPAGGSRELGRDDPTRHDRRDDPTRQDRRDDPTRHGGRARGPHDEGGRRTWGEPLRREPLGEEIGYDSDYSRSSAVPHPQYSGRSLPRRSRTFSGASQASQASSRVPPPGGFQRPARGYNEAYRTREMSHMTYEQQCQYYYQYYQDHPYYKDNPYYKEYLRQWYGGAQGYQAHQSSEGPQYDDSASLHSGRCSVNDNLKKSISSGELSGVASVTGEDVGGETPQRLTPTKFGRPHIKAQFTPTGQLVMVLPRDPREGESATVQLRDVRRLLSLDPQQQRTLHQLEKYPGPLTLTETHKDEVIRYCEQQQVEVWRGQHYHDPQSAALIWQYLALLVKQNGKLYGSDVAALLLRSRTESSRPHKQTRGRSASPSEDGPQMSPEGVDEASLSPQDEGIGLAQPEPSASPAAPARDEAALLKKLREYLCLGRRREAVDYAMREGLWGHALALAYRMDSTTHTRVLAAFSASIPSTDVVLTLFHQLSGKRPEVTKSYSQQQWGDWHHHLAVMVSNPTGQTQRDQASIVALGDTLATQGRLHAAHFCYLVADVQWGSYCLKDSKLVLIGSSHRLPFQAFATNEAIQCTEVYEFARSLDPTNPSLDTFQSYKLVYALRLTECGFPTEALRYCQVISSSVHNNPGAYQVGFLSQVYDLACCLKYHDLHYHMCQGEVSDMPDPAWLLQLRSCLDAAHAQAASTTPTASTPSHEAPAHPSAQPYQSSYDAYQPTVGYSEDQPHNTTADVLDNNTAYQPHYHPAGPDSSLPSVGEVTTGESAVLAQEGEASSSEVPVMVQSSREAEPAQYPYSGGGYVDYPPPSDPSHYFPQPVSTPQDTHTSLPHSTEMGREQPREDVVSGQPSSLPPYPSYPQHHLPYQPWDTQQQQSLMNNSQQSLASSTPPHHDSSEPQRSPEEEAYWAEMAGKKERSGSTTSGEGQAKAEDKEETNSTNKTTTATGEGKPGWSISNLFGWKKSKQAVLPDDKNPPIVWDEKQKKWVNQDGDTEVSGPPPPPPKLVPKGPGGGPPAFTAARGGMKKLRYVNTERDSGGGGGSPSPLLPPMMAHPTSTSPSLPPNLMMPQPSAPQEASPAHDGRQHYQEPQQPAIPQVAQGLLSEGGEGPGGAVPMMAPPTQPQLFNPLQFQSSAPAAPAASAAPGPRRPGPGRRPLPGKR